MLKISTLPLTKQLPTGAHCRICGTAKLNTAHYASDLSDQIGLYQVLIGDNSIDQLIKPCDCRGDFAYAHKVCLSEWIETTKHEYCDVCRFRYNVQFLDRTIFDWMLETQQVWRIFRLLCTTTLIYYISSLGILNHFLSRRPPSNVFSVMVFASSCIWGSMCTISLVFYALWLWCEFKSWQKTNRRVLVDENKNPQLESKPKQTDVLKSSGFKRT